MQFSKTGVVIAKLVDVDTTSRDGWILPPTVRSHGQGGLSRRAAILNVVGTNAAYHPVVKNRAEWQQRYGGFNLLNITWGEAVQLAKLAHAKLGALIALGSARTCGIRPPAPPRAVTRGPELA
jgi:hypothetical protein